MFLASLQSVSTFNKHGQPKKLQRRQPPTTLPKAWYSLLAALFMELGFVEVATRQAPRTCDRTGAWKQGVLFVSQGWGCNRQK
jgi:hypothetical protein